MNTKLFLAFLLFLASLSSIDVFESKVDAQFEQKIPILIYHDISESNPKNVNEIIHPDKFSEHMHALKDAGYETITLADLKRVYEGNSGVLPEKPLMITFDDGYLSNYEIAFPMLEKLEMHASIFTLVSRMDENHPNYFTWKNAMEMLGSGWIDIQSHTYNHHYYINEEDNYAPALTTIGAEESYEEYSGRIREDLFFAKNRMESELDTNIYAFAFPYGAYNEEAVAVARDCGYKLLFTAEEKLSSIEDIKNGLVHRVTVSKYISGEDLVKKLENMN